MKEIAILRQPAFLKKFTLVLFTLFISVITFAQDDTKKVDVDISTDSGGDTFWASPWVWIVGGAIFILLLVALLRGGGRRDT
ncbi:MAG: hypothetical protein H0V30_05195 [Chitinophagaceae bacterium]|jgi:hypothetical protein|nr:hypothetical protein [Chitinophagaceae bacterium]